MYVYIYTHSAPNYNPSLKEKFHQILDHVLLCRKINQCFLYNCSCFLYNFFYFAVSEILQNNSFKLLLCKHFHLSEFYRMPLVQSYKGSKNLLVPI